MNSLEDIQKLIKSVGEPGNIHEDAVAYALHLKGIELQKKEKEFNAFVMNSSEIGRLSEIIYFMIKHCKVNIRFQMAFSCLNASLNHWSFLEFQFRIVDEYPALDILVCDPLGFNNSLVLLNLISSTMELGYLAKLCNLCVYLPTDTLQEGGRFCAYFALDNICMLANQDEFGSVYIFMTEHQDKEALSLKNKLLSSFRESVSMCYESKTLDNIYNFTVITSTLPARLLRTKQHVSSLYMQITNIKQDEAIVNHKGKTFWQSVNQNLFFVEDRHGKHWLRNLRINLKMKRWEERMSEATLNRDVESFKNVVKEHRLMGLAALIEKVSEKKLVDTLSY